VYRMLVEVIAYLWLIIYSVSNVVAYKYFVCLF
jgi:hypothetical protein